MKTTRRSVLRASGMAAVLGATGLAGCGGLLDGGGDGTVNDWVYDPNVVASSPTVFFGSIAYGAIYEMREDLPQAVQSGFESDAEVPIQPADVENAAVVGGGEVGPDGDAGTAFGSGVLTGSIPRRELESELESNDSVEAAGSYEGYSLYEGTDLQEQFGGMPGAAPVDVSGTAAVGDSAVLGGASLAQNMETSATGEAAVQTMIDAANGAARRLSTTDGPAREVQSRVGDDMIAMGASVDADVVDVGEDFGPGGEFQQQLLAGLRAGGAGVDLDGETGTLTGVLVYESDRRATESRVVDIVNGASGNLEGREGIERVDASQEGAVIVVTVEGNLEALAQTGMQNGGGFASPATQ
jgi:hypothetical protein